MKLPFRYQFVLAPLIITLLLACLVTYTLIEFSNIKQGNKETRRWEVLTNLVHTSINSAIQLNTIAQELQTKNKTEEDDDFFNYLEHANILSNSLNNKFLLEHVPSNLKVKIKSSEILLREPEKHKYKIIINSISKLLPALEHQYKISLAKRRTAILEYHHKLKSTNSRMTTTLLSALIACIILAIGLTIWGLKVTRSRLKQLSERAHAASIHQLTSDQNPKRPNKSKYSNSLDELDDLEKSLTSMTSQLLKVVSVENVFRGAEKERRRIAMDMHDGILADLTAINRSVESYRDDSSLESINTIDKDVLNVINNLRNIIDDLHPQVLEILGLESALSSHLTRHFNHSTCPKYHLDFDANIEKHISIEIKLSLYRIITEAITNALKHAQCSQVEISLRLNSNLLIASVEDNGIGMPENTIFKGYGISNMSERALLIDASVKWHQSRFANGTCFKLALKLKEPL